MKVIVTGAHGFIGRNLLMHLRLRGHVDIVEFGRDHSWADLEEATADVDFVFHLAGVNRPRDQSEFELGNAALTRRLCEVLAASGRKIPILLSSSIQATADNPYGASKLAAEQALLDYGRLTGAPVFIYRLPNVFGKWCRPNYNSVVATFCHCISRNLSIRIDDPQAPLRLVYIDDVVSELVAAMQRVAPVEPFLQVTPEYRTTVGEVAEHLRAFRESRESLISERVGVGFLRALHATYVSYLPTESFAYDVPKYADPRGVFVEMLKTKDSGQFSYFTALPGVTRGGHYHHSKTEKFLVISGSARFRFRSLLTGETYELFTAGDKPQIVETIPGWTHDITNVGTRELVVMLWANEIFDRQRPDTYHCAV